MRCRRYFLSELTRYLPSERDFARHRATPLRCAAALHGHYRYWLIDAIAVSFKIFSLIVYDDKQRNAMRISDEPRLVISAPLSCRSARLAAAPPAMPSHDAMIRGQIDDAFRFTTPCVSAEARQLRALHISGALASRDAETPRVEMPRRASMEISLRRRRLFDALSTRPFCCRASARYRHADE